MRRIWIAGSLLLLTAACAKEAKVSSAPGGSADRGRQLIETRYSCTSCHSIPNVEGPRGMVGPPLDHIASRQIIAGKLQNTPENMTRWLQDPQGVVPGNAMPNMNIDERDAKDITAFLFSLK